MSRPDLGHRDRQPEWMDDPSLATELHEAALRGLQRVNRISRTVASLWPIIRRYCDRGPVRLLDVGCGGGDLAIGIARCALRERLPIEVVGADISETALQFAARQVGDLPVRFERLDILNQPLPQGFDLITCSLFLHHLDDDMVRTLFRNVVASSARAFLASDLRRGRLAYGLTWIMTRILSRSPVVHVDGPLSVRAAFTIPEIRRLAEQAGLMNANVRPIWPFRFLMHWERAG